MKYQLRPYQQEAVDKAIAALSSSNPRPSIIQAATGFGKSLIIGAICHELTKLDPKAGVLILAPSKELLEQDQEKLEAYDIDDIKVYSASAGVKEVGKYTIATIGSIYKKPSLFTHVKYVLIDECQYAKIDSDGMYLKFFARLGITRILGLTATPYKLRIKACRDGRMLETTAVITMMNRFPPIKSKNGHPVFAWGNLIYKKELWELQKMGYLAPIKYYSEMPKATLKLNSTGADYTKESIQQFANDNWNRILTVLIALLRRDNPKRVLVFCPSVESSQRIAEAVRQQGFTADDVNGKTSKKERTEKIARFKSGETQVMCNCQCLTAGFDLPALDTIVYARPTLSPTVWIQAIGRGVRQDPDNPNKVLKVYDLVGCARTISPIESIRLAKDGFKDCLVGRNGQMDNVPLRKFRIELPPRKEKKDEEVKL